jgi:hypothetical protein
VKITPFDLGCEPSPSEPAEALLQDGTATYLLFFARSQRLNDRGHWTDLGVAVVECKGCVMSRFGCPNDEGLPEHPLYHHGLSDADSSILEISDSPWAKEISSQCETSRQRLWSKQALQEHGPVVPRHFIVLLKERTFECLADSLVVAQYFTTFGEARQFVISVMEQN